MPFDSKSLHILQDKSTTDTHSIFVMVIFRMLLTELKDQSYVQTAKRGFHCSSEPNGQKYAAFSFAWAAFMLARIMTAN